MIEFKLPSLKHGMDGHFSDGSPVRSDTVKGRG